MEDITNNNKDLRKTRTEESRYLIENFDPFRTVFFYEGKYHALVHDESIPHPFIKDWCLEISDVEAEEKLRNPEWDLWILWNSDGTAPKPPESCPSWLLISIHVVGNIEDFIQLYFDIHRKETIVKCLTKN